MIENLYDSVLSITQESGYLNRLEKTNIPSPLRWSQNKELLGDDFFKIKYPILAFTHDTLLYTPVCTVIGENKDLLPLQMNIN